MTIKPHTNTEKQLSAAQISPPMFRHLLIVAILGFSAIWAIDAYSGVFAIFNAYSYPLCITAFILIYVLSFTSWLNHQSLHYLAYFVVSGYLISCSIWHHLPENGQFSNSAQWLGLNYVIVYLFLDVKRTAPVTFIVFVATITGHYIALVQAHTTSEAFAVAFNMAIAHAIYIFLLWTVIKLRVKTDQVIARADMLEDFAYIDVLTRALNRRGIEKVFNELDLDSAAQQKNYSLLIIDIDHFKQINDLNGHLIGDKVLTSIAGKLSRTIHPNDILGRWGGEEFIILSLDRTPQQVMALAENLRVAVSQLVIDDITNITVSIGIGHSHEASSKEALFKIADDHLYDAKQSGRNTIRATQV